MDATERKKQESKLRREASRKSALQPTSTPATDGADDAPAKRKARKARRGSGPESRTFGGLSGMLEDINITELSAQAWTAAPWLAGFLSFAVQNAVVRLLLLAFLCWRCDGVTKAQWLGSRLGLCAPPPEPEVAEAADALNAGAASDDDGACLWRMGESSLATKFAADVEAAAAAGAADEARKRSCWTSACPLIPASCSAVSPSDVVAITSDTWPSSHLVASAFPAIACRCFAWNEPPSGG